MATNLHARTAATPLLVSFDPASRDLAFGELRSCEPVDVAPGLALVERWPSRDPVFVRHRFPVQAVVTPRLDAVVDSGVALIAGASRRCSVQTRVVGTAGFAPRDVNEPVAAASPVPVDVRHPLEAVSVVVASGHAYLGLSSCEFNRSAWAGGERRFAREPGQISRSEFKLLEALEVFGVELPARGRAIDLGAAPGGWSRVLAARGLRVTAVDPAAMARPMDGVEHVRERAERYVDRAGACDVLVSDLRMDARDAARLLCDYAPAVRHGGAALTTLKLPRRGAARVLAEALRELRLGFEVAAVRQLFHNRSEVTASLSVGAAAPTGRERRRASRGGGRLAS